MDKINEAGCHKVRQMADGRDGKIVLMVVENDGKSTDAQGNLTDPVDLLRCGFFCGCNNVVGILQKMVRRALIAGLFRTRHRMAADKHILVTQTFHRLMDVCLRASDISDQRTRFQKRAYLFEVYRVVFYRGAEKNNVTCGECLIDPVKDNIDGPVRFCLLKL